MEGEVLPADPTYSLYFDVVYMNPARTLYFEYADDYLKLDSATTDSPHVITIRVWASREKDGVSVLPAEKSWRVDLLRAEGDVRLTELTAHNAREPQRGWPRVDGLFGA